MVCTYVCIIIVYLHHVGISEQQQHECASFVVAGRCRASKLLANVPSDGVWPKTNNWPSYCLHMSFIHWILCSSFIENIYCYLCQLIRIVTRGAANLCAVYIHWQFPRMSNVWVHLHYEHEHCERSLVCARWLSRTLSEFWSESYEMWVKQLTQSFLCCRRSRLAAYFPLAVLVRVGVTPLRTQC